ncbi:MAG: hypothetical protein C4335_06385 [Armatimonadota bacterium]
MEVFLMGEQHSWSRVWLGTVVVCSCLLAHTVSSFASPSLILLGTLPGHASSGAMGVSAGGSVVVGWSETASGALRAFRWTSGSGMQELEFPTSQQSIAYGVSADGSTVVGYALVSGGLRVVRWRAETGAEDLGTFPPYGTGGVALGVSQTAQW